MIINAGIKKIYYLYTYPDKEAITYLYESKICLTKCELRDINKDGCITIERLPLLTNLYDQIVHEEENTEEIYIDISGK